MNPIRASLAGILLSCTAALPFHASALLYRYDVLLRGQWGIDPSPYPDDPQRALTEWVSIPGTAQISYPSDFLAFEYPHAEYGDYGEVSPKTASTPLQLDLCLGPMPYRDSGIDLANGVLDRSVAVGVFAQPWPTAHGLA